MTKRGRPAKDQADLLSRLGKCTTQFDIFRLLRELADAYGFNYFFIASSPDQGPKTFADMMIITSAPAALVQRYEDSGLIKNSPLADALNGIGAPDEYRLDTPDLSTSPARQTALSAFRKDYNLDCWFIVPVYHPDHGPAAVCFLGKREAMDFTEKASLALFGHVAHHKLRFVSAKPAKVDSPLTERERECLVWTSAGKTSVEIARILDLSEHTVNHYLNNAARKLDAVNRTQAVAYAIRNSFID
ncbi:LuxR family transcriptional regulator [Hoeflea sp. G2-23]|uniref:LuxR family transcriptional regulator n=1 Tax=Hoeflea algicola TaxID=2983763 RepID=A0ABT3ZF34_9HYPH|nr:LuxR family transcriptional regulator [Hoeflea algicola]MCY0150308.1 LuxR family transcriptional regulator [Hoeflea algicola]